MTEDQVRTHDKNPDVERFDRWAASYDRSIAQRFFFMPIHRSMLGVIEQELGQQAPGCIVDVGCGTGRFLRQAALRWPRARLCGFDPAEQMIGEARRLLPAGTFTLASAESLPFPDSAADLVVTSMSFHHWADQARGVREIARVLKPGALFCLTDHSFVASRLFGGNVRSRREVRELMIGAGLTVLRQRAILPGVVASVAGKR